jgi:Helicase C-terminal domain
LYENSQSECGEAIRHREDYAAIVMVDKRFGNERIRGKLPRWIREGLVKGAEEKPFAELVGGLSAFFKFKEEMLRTVWHEYVQDCLESYRTVDLIDRHQ